MPNFAIVDTHVHLWDTGRLRYPWLSGVPSLNKPHLLADYRQACGPVEVAKMVFVQCDCDPAQSQQEAEWVTDLAREDSRIRGIVARVSLEQGESAEPAIAKLAALPLVKGVRRLIQGEADPEFSIRPDFVRGVQLLHRHGLSFDLCLKQPQLANAIKLVRQCPDVNFVLDHIGKPDIKGRQLDAWRAEIRELAQLGNVWCKLSGMVTEADHANWKPADLRPYIDNVIACFGFKRVMFGSDWPVSTLATDYPRWVTTVDEALRGCTTDEMQQLYVRNAETFYRV
jgi:L-fuconolactonase